MPRRPGSRRRDRRTSLPRGQRGRTLSRTRSLRPRALSALRNPTTARCYRRLMTEHAAPKTAAMLIIGNELLSGKVEDANLAVLARELRVLGVRLRRVVMVLDDIDTIAREVRLLSDTHDWLFTSGGVGPTHDDVTIEAVAKAFGVPVVTSEPMADMLRAHYKERCTEGHLRMALVPRGASLETTEEIKWPTIRIGYTWVMPGIPE